MEDIMELTLVNHARVQFDSDRGADDLAQEAGWIASIGRTVWCRCRSTHFGEPSVAVVCRKDVSVSGQRGFIAMFSGRIMAPRLARVSSDIDVQDMYRKTSHQIGKPRDFVFRNGPCGDVCGRDRVLTFTFITDLQLRYRGQLVGAVSLCASLEYPASTIQPSRHVTLQATSVGEDPSLRSAR